MSLSQKSALATIIRQKNQGLLTDIEAYHMICELFMVPG